MSARIEQLLARLRKGIDKTMAIFNAISPAQWEAVLYEEPYPWTVRDLLAHFVSAEEGLLRIAQDIAAGGPGAPEGFDYDAYNAAEQKRLADIPPESLLAALYTARQRTIEWVKSLQETDLDRKGRHPALGEIDLETFINAIYGHQLLHMRDLMQAWG
ncbi:MAG TPA: DinB family protein [Anaerolineales bacterium]|nr:DinB family protein [Anaerolineae bacterium]HIQ00813.1 DinB family protein [Anaerolineales bacterium]